MGETLRATFTAAATVIRAKSDGTTVRARGMIVPWGVPGRTSRGWVPIRRDALTLPDDLGRVKLTMEHDDTQPVAVLEAAESDDIGLHGTFRYGSTTAAMTAAAELADGLRDGLSVDLIDVRFNTAGEVVAATLKAVSQVAIPAYEDARALAAARHDTTTGDTMTTDTAAAPAPAADPLPVPAPAAALTAAARTAPASAVHELADRLLAARFDRGDSGVTATLTAALADITPAGNGAGHELAGLATQAAGQLMDAAPKPVFDIAVTGQRLTGMEVTGWHWDTPPTVGDYAGNKAEIPTNAAKLKSVTTAAQRIAGGHDLDRVYVDLGSRDVLVSYWQLMAEDVTRKMDAKRAAAVTAAAGAPAAAASAAAAILAGVTSISGADYVIVSGDLVSAELGKPNAEVPSLFAGGGIAAVDVPRVTVAPDLTGTVIVGRRSAVKFYTTEPPLRFEAVHIARGGVDAGVFAYYASLPSPFGGVKAYTVAAAVAASTTTAATK